MILNFFKINGNYENVTLKAIADVELCKRHEEGKNRSTYQSKMRNI